MSDQTNSEPEQPARVVVVGPDGVAVETDMRTCPAASAR